MKKDNIFHFFSISLKKIKRSFNLNDFLIFLFFLLISSSLWFLHSLRKNYETTIRIPVKFEHLPQGFIQSNELPENIKVVISGRGTSLMNYKLGKSFFPITIDYTEYLESKSLATASLKPVVQQQLNVGTEILEIKPDSLFFVFHRMKYKTVPVKLSGKIELERQYSLCDSVVVEPKEVIVYAPENVLDTLQYAYTLPFTIPNVKDTLSMKMGLMPFPDVEYSDPEISILVKTEIYTEKSLQVPIFVDNLPADMNLRIFPSYVDLSFHVGVSQYDKIEASSFYVSVDYKDISKFEKSLPVKLKGIPKRVFHVQIKQKSVDFLVEAKK
ncbi:MAG TPA: YbbR-like domain-containing protein [Paludibacteraceae bacterium]|jgi:hypothetical protein|nr:YbbR-like domain-containing protein [Paludibacteraceae bacterium]HQF51261.1 YbbR-like domain-containing protein [Paludibacteraceae bacterium]